MIYIKAWKAEGQNKPLLLKLLRLSFSFIELLYIQMNLLGNCIHCWLCNSALGLVPDLIFSFSECHIVQFWAVRVQKAELRHTNHVAIKHTE